jgi:hypothetical protein
MPAVSKRRRAQQKTASTIKRSSINRFGKREDEEEYVVHEEGQVNFEDNINDEEEDESHIVDQEDVWVDIESDDENSQDERDGDSEDDEYEINEYEDGEYEKEIESE